MISEETARLYFKDQDPIGKQLEFGWGRDGVRLGGEIVGIVGDVRQESKPYTSYSSFIQTSEFFHTDVLVHAHDPGRSSIHVLQRIDDDPVIRSVASGLNNDETPKAHLLDQNLSLFLPCCCERTIFRFGRQWKQIERPNHMHMRIDRPVRHRE